ncbi:MAG: hypothetical protein VX589_17170, partial [Myxococcota bacterium]|nr:hypothetical protein [Myxococcota bacterium]
TRFDNTLYLRQACNGPDLICASDRAGDAAAPVLRLIVPQPDLATYVVVDGRTPQDFGAYTLNVAKVGDLVNPFEGQTCGTARDIGEGQHQIFVAPGSEYEGSCTPGFDIAGRGETVLRFRAPVNDVYVFSAESRAMAPTLYLRADCQNGPDLICTPGQELTPGVFNSVVIEEMDAGEVVYVFVDGTEAGDPPAAVELQIIGRRDIER